MDAITKNIPWMQGEGQVRALLRSFDWSACDFGHPHTWPRELHTVVELMLQSIYPAALGWGADLLLLYNDAYAEKLGVKHPAALCSNFKKTWPEIWHDIAPIFESALAGNASYFEDVPFTIATSLLPKQRWFTSSYSPIRSSNGSVAGVFNTALETTERVLSEKAQAFRLKLSDCLRPLTEPEQITALASQLLGVHLGLARVGYVEIDGAADAVTMKQDWTNGEVASLSGKVFGLEDFGPGIKHLLRKGQVLAVNDVDLDSHAVPNLDTYRANGIRAFLAVPLMKSGRLRAILYAHQAQVHYWSEYEIGLASEMLDRTRDAVESAHAQTELRHERDQSQYVFDSMTEGFMMLDARWTVLQMNAEGLRMAQRCATEVIGRVLWDAWPQTRGAELERLYRQVMYTRVAGTLEYHHRLAAELDNQLADGQTVWIEVRIFPMLDGGLAVFHRDINERKLAEEKLREADQRKDEFLAMLAHELRNPLAPIGAAAQLLHMARLDDQGVRMASETIIRQAKHMTHLVDDLLDVSRVTRGLVELDALPLDIRHIVTDAVEQVGPLIRCRNLHLVLHLPPETTIVTGDQKRLVQVLANLLNNAAKYTQEGGNILLKTEVRDGHVQLSVIDDGIGMEPGLAERVFDLFAQAERTSDRSSGGLGLGLALVRSLVELHGGTVACSSDGGGKGSTFTVCLPRVPCQDRQGAGPGAEHAFQTAHRPLRVMVVDDNVDAAAMLAMLLEASGHQVSVEHGSHQALGRVAMQRPDVCLLDIGLPDMDGNELARQIRARPETANTVLIAVTGYGQQSDRDHSLAAGFDHHLVKPVDSAQLSAILANVGRS